MMKKTRQLSLALTWLVLALAPFPLIIIVNLGLIDSFDRLFIYDLGIVAYVWWLMIVLLSTRPYWLVQRIGMPALYGIHGALGVMALLLATIHRFGSFSMHQIIKQTGTIAWYLEIFLLAYAVLFLSEWLVDHIYRFARLKSWIEKHLLNHQVTVWIHRLNFAVIALIWVHVISIPRLRVIPGFFTAFNIYTGLTLVVYCLWKLRFSKRYSTATVKQNVSLNDSIQELTLQLDGQAKSYRAGDFYFLAFKKVKGISKEAHPFSVSSAPKEDPNEVSFMIHRRGDFTKQLPEVTVGAKVSLEGPFGLFDQEVRADNAPLVLYGLGSGVAPLISLAKQYAKTRPVHLIWSGPQVSDLYYQDLLKDLEKEDVKVDAKVHRFTQDALTKVISNDEIANAKVIIIGSASRVLQVRKTLHKLGFTKDCLLDERMTL